jgi:hypothetical protein
LRSMDMKRMGAHGGWLVVFLWDVGRFYFCCNLADLMLLV